GLQEAQELAGKKEYSQAHSVLVRAESLLQRPTVWLEHARQTVRQAYIAKTAIADSLAGLPETPRTFSSWPGRRAAELEDQLMVNDGSEAAARAEQLSKRLSEIRTLIGLRGQLARAAEQARFGASIDELRDEYQTVEARVAEGDDTLVRLRL